MHSMPDRKSMLVALCHAKNLATRGEISNIPDHSCRKRFLTPPAAAAGFGRHGARCCFSLLSLVKIILPGVAPVALLLGSVQLFP